MELLGPIGINEMGILSLILAKILTILFTVLLFPTDIIVLAPLLISSKRDSFKFLTFFR